MQSKDTPLDCDNCQNSRTVWGIFFTDSRSEMWNLNSSIGSFLLFGYSCVVKFGCPEIITVCIALYRPSFVIMVW